MNERDVRDDTIHLLKIFARHDSLVIFFAFGALWVSVPIVALIITLWPFLVFISGYLTSKPLPHQLKQHITCKYPESERTILRQSEIFASQAYSLPFLKMIVLSQEITDDFFKGRPCHIEHLNGVVAHEIGHMYHFDRIVISWIRTTIFVYVFSVLVYFLMHLKVHLPFIAVNPLFIFAPNLVQSAFLMATLIFLSVSLFHRVSHRREYIADLYAANIQGSDFKIFLQKNARRDANSKASNIFTIFYNAMTHPRFTDRLNLVSGHASSDHIRPIQIGVQWIALLFIVLNVNGAHNHDYLRIVFIFLFLGALIWTFIKINSLACNVSLCRRLLFQYITGILLGIGVFISLDIALNITADRQLWYARLSNENFRNLADVLPYWIFVGLFSAFLYQRVGFLKKINTIFYSCVMCLVIIAAGFNHAYIKDGIVKLAKRHLADHLLMIQDICQSPMVVSVGLARSQCLIFENEILESALVQLERKAEEKLKQASHLDLEFMLWEWEASEPPIYPEPPMIQDSHTYFGKQIKGEIKEWEEKTGKRFIDDHPTMKNIEILASEETFQPLPNTIGRSDLSNLRAGVFVSLFAVYPTFYYNIWSWEEGVCWVNKGMTNLQSIKCGEAYRTWMRDLYMAESNIGAYAPDYYVNDLKYRVQLPEKLKRYEETLGIYNAKQYKNGKTFQQEKQDRIDILIKDDKAKIMERLKFVKAQLDAL